MPTMIRLLLSVTVVNCAAPASVLAQQITAFKTGERETGATKQCIYDALGSEYTHTVSAVTPCPFTIRVDRRTAAPATARAGAARGLAEGLGNLGVMLAERRERDRLDSIARDQRELERAPADKKARVASADSWLARLLPSDEAGVLTAAIDTLVIEKYQADYRASDHYRNALQRYYEINAADGPEAADRFLRREALAYMEAHPQTRITPQQLAVRILVRELFREYFEPEAYQAALRTHYEIDEKQGREASGRFWASIASDSLPSYVQKRWAELNPWLDGQLATWWLLLVEKMDRSRMAR